MLLQSITFTYVIQFSYFMLEENEKKKKKFDWFTKETKIEVERLKQRTEMVRVIVNYCNKL